MASRILLRRGLKSELPTGADGEPLFCTDTKELYIGNGGSNTKIGGGESHSETPVEIGTWVDGKKIYRKSGVKTYKNYSMDTYPEYGFHTGYSGTCGGFSGINYSGASAILREDYFVFTVADEDGQHFSSFEDATKYAREFKVADSGSPKNGRTITVYYTVDYIAKEG